MDGNREGGGWMGIGRDGGREGGGMEVRMGRVEEGIEVEKEGSGEGFRKGREEGGR